MPTPKINNKFIQNASIKSIDDVFVQLESSAAGLNILKVNELLKRDGLNEIGGRKKMSAVKNFLLRLRSPLILTLFVIGTISLFLNDLRSAIVVYAMILLSVVIDFVQEHKSEKTVEKLKSQVVTKVEVIRDGKKVSLEAKHLVAGDVICLSVGSIVPADARIIESDDFFTNESSLTGEAFPVAKHRDTLSKLPADISDYDNIIFTGTDVVSGYATAVVLVTGERTVFGRIAAKLAEPSLETEFEKGVKNFGNLIIKVILSLVFLIFFVNTIIAKHDFLSSVMFALALAVGLTPELLPMIMSITLARGSVDMSKKGVIVKRLNSIHDFGGMSVLCTDKTGTLTENKIKMVKHIDIDGNISTKILDYVYLNSYYQAGLANPLDEAVLRIKEKVKVSGWNKLDEIPFDFSRRRLSVILESIKTEEMIMISKGSPEEMFTVASFYEDNGEIKKFDKKYRSQALKKYHELSADGFRVLTLAYKKVSEKKREYPIQEECDLILLGFVAFLDPAKKGAKAAINLLEARGIEIKIITGDNDLVTKKICHDVGVDIKGILTGPEVDAMTDEDLKNKVMDVTIFSRISPEGKARIVSAIRENKVCVGYMGDGINDALPLKAADVGISVNNAVDVAKEAADLILLTKDLKVLALGVEEGRRTFGNTMKYILMGLSSNFGNMFSVAAASFCLPFLPMLPIQILLNNFLYDFSQITIPLDNVDEEYIKKPKRWDVNFIKKYMVLFGPLSSIFDITTFVVMIKLFHANASNFQTAWFLESFATQTLVIFFIRTRKIPFIESRPSKYLAASILFFCIIAMIIPFSPLAAYFGFTRPTWGVLAAIWFIVIVYLLLVQTVKKGIYKKYFV